MPNTKYFLLCSYVHSPFTLPQRLQIPYYHCLLTFISQHPLPPSSLLLYHLFLIFFLHCAQKSATRLPDPCLSSNSDAGLGEMGGHLCWQGDFTYQWPTGQSDHLSTSPIFPCILRSFSHGQDLFGSLQIVQHFSWISSCYVEVPHRRDPH